MQELSVAGDPASGSASYRDAAKKALPSVVHIFTSQKISMPRHPLIDDPIFRHFFGNRPESDGQRNSSGLGSGVTVAYTHLDVYKRQASMPH